MFLAFQLGDLVRVPFGWLLGQLYHLTNNYGFAMIIFALAVNLVLLPIICGVTYEFNRYVGAHDDKFSRALRAPGMWMQNFTTNEPDDSMIEVASTAVEAVLPEEEGADRW